MTTNSGDEAGFGGQLIGGGLEMPLATVSGETREPVWFYSSYEIPPTTPLGKRKKKISPYVLEQLKREIEILQPILGRRVKVAVSKRATYPNPEDRKPVEEIPP
ncbi:hypothetical protein ACLOJK_030171 [Asimina triloba]